MPRHGAVLSNADVPSLSSGLVPTAELGSGTADTTKFLRGDRTWAVPSSGGVTSLEATSPVARDQATGAVTLSLLTVPVGKGGTGLTAFSQGDLLFASAANTVAALVKDANATRYLSNTGASNSPAWAQVNLANGVTGNLPVGNLNGGSGASASTFWRGDGAWATPAGGGGATSNARVTSPDVTTTLNTAVNVTGLSVALAANEVWTAEFNLSIGCSGTGGVKFALTVPTGATFRGVALGMAAAVTAVTSSIMTASGTLSVAFNAVALATGWARITVGLTNGANAGNLQLQFASTTSGQTSTVFVNSYVTARKL